MWAPTFRHSQNKSPNSDTSAKQKNLSADTNNKKMPCSRPWRAFQMSYLWGFILAKTLSWKSCLCEDLGWMEVEWSTQDEFGLREVERMSAIPRWWGTFMASSRSWGPSQQPWGTRRAGDTGGQWGGAAQSDPTQQHSDGWKGGGITSYTNREIKHT